MLRMVNVDVVKQNFERMVETNATGENGLAMRALDKAKEFLRKGDIDKAQGICFEVIKILAKVECVRDVKNGFENDEILSGKKVA